MKTVEELIDQLKCGDEAAQIEAATKLQELGERATTARFELGNVLRTSNDQAVRKAVFSALLQINPDAIRTSLKLRQLDADKISWRDYAQTLKDNPQAARIAIENWIDNMSVDEGVGDLETIIGLSEIGRAVPDTIPNLVISLLEHPSKRRNLAHALGQVGHERAEVVDHAIALLDNQETAIRELAAEILEDAHAFSARSVPAMLAIAREEREFDVSFLIEWSLCSIARESPEAVDVLLNDMQKNEGEPIDVAWVLGEAANESEYALARLSKMLIDPDGSIRAKAAIALLYVERADTSEWIEIYRTAFRDEDSSVRRSAVYSLRGSIRTHWQDLIPLLRDALVDQDDDTVRYCAAKYLGEMGQRAKVAASDLARACQDKSESVRRAATDALEAVTADD